jgi:hypothetical protein
MTRLEAVEALRDVVRQLDDLSHDTLDVLAHEVWAVGLHEHIERKRRLFGVEPAAAAPIVVRIAE